MPSKNTLIAWLNDAHAMEKSLIKVMERQINSVDEDAELKTQLQEHLDITHTQVERIERCLETLGEKPSTAKTVLGKIGGYIEGLSSTMASDKVVKGVLMNYAAEKFEEACYQALIVAAQDLGEDEVVATCEEILSEEQEMADWLEDYIPTAVRNYNE